MSIVRRLYQGLISDDISIGVVIDSFELRQLVRMSILYSIIKDNLGITQVLEHVSMHDEINDQSYEYFLQILANGKIPIDILAMIVYVLKSISYGGNRYELERGFNNYLYLSRGNQSIGFPGIQSKRLCTAYEICVKMTGLPNVPANESDLLRILSELLPQKSLLDIETNVESMLKDNSQFVLASRLFAQQGRIYNTLSLFIFHMKMMKIVTQILDTYPSPGCKRSGVLSRFNPLNDIQISFMSDR